MTALAPTLQAFFTDRLIAQRHASPNTVAAYRDTLRLLLGFAAPQLGRQASKFDFADLDAPLIGAFLQHLEHDRHNSVRTRNARLAAIHSLFRYAALRHPEHAALDRTRARDPTQAIRPGPHHLPHRTRSRRATSKSRPQPVSSDARSPVWTVSSHGTGGRRAYWRMRAR